MRAIPAQRDSFGLVTIAIVPYAVALSGVGHQEPSSTVLLGVSMALVPFVLVPLILTRLVAPQLLGTQVGGVVLRAGGRKWALRLGLVPLACLVATGWYTGREHGRFRGMFSEPTRYPKLLDRA